MDFRQLRYFVAVAEARNIGRAAERLHLSQPPLTRQIQSLERELGVQLFIRTARGVELTQAGEQLLVDARNIQVLFDQTAERAQGAGQGKVGRLDVGIFGSAIFDIVPRILSKFTERHPAVKVVLHNAQMPSQVTALRQGRVLIVFERQDQREADIEVELVAREPLILAVNAAHPLAQLDVVAVEALKDQPMIMQLGATSVLKDTAMSLYRAHGFEPRTHQEVGDVVTATVLVSTGCALCLVPASMRNVQVPNVVYRPIRSRVDAFMELHCFYLKNERSPLLAAVLETIRTNRHGSI